MRTPARIILIVGLSLIMLASLFPPMRISFAPRLENLSYGRAFIFNLTGISKSGYVGYRGEDVKSQRKNWGTVSSQVDYYRLVVEWIIISAGAGVALLITIPSKPMLIIDHLRL